MTKTTDYILIGGLGLVGYLFYTKYIKTDEKKEQRKEEQFYGTAKTETIRQYNVPTMERSSLNPNYTLVRTVTPSGELTTYRVLFSDLTDYQKLYLSNNNYTVKSNDVIVPTITKNKPPLPETTTNKVLSLFSSNPVKIGVNLYNKFLRKKTEARFI